MPNEKILVVEDEGIVAEDLRRSLGRLGYEVPGVASSGEEAVRLAAECEPDLVLMDVVLPGTMDGIEAAHQIRAHQNIPVMYLTAYSDERTVERAKATDPIGYLVKPFVANGLKAAIETALHPYQRRQRLSELRFRSLLESAPDAMVIVGQRGQIDLVNTQTEKLFGYPREELLGKPIEILMPERFRQAHVGHRSRYTADPRPVPWASASTLRRAQDGTEFPSRSASARRMWTGPMVHLRVRDPPNASGWNGNETKPCGKLR